MRVTVHYTGSKWEMVSFLLTVFRRIVAGAKAATRGIRSSRYTKLRRYSAAAFLVCTLSMVTFAAIGLHHIYLDQTNLPDLEAFVRCEFPGIGHVYDINDQPEARQT
jgi:hypothetical protein